MTAADLDFCPEYKRYFEEPAGKEHYRFLEDLVRVKKGVVVDVGTLYGSSALALSTNPEVTVWTYDIMDHVPWHAGVRKRRNIDFRLKNGIDAVPDFVNETDLIVLDVDPHDGKQERAFFEALETEGYKGVVVCDDIHLNEAMETWWNGVTQRKEDKTDVGHWSGTGVVYFD